MGRFLAGLLMGLVTGGALAFGIGLFWLTYVNTDQREGAAAMGVMFFFIPAGALLGGLIGAVLGLRRRG